MLKIDSIWWHNAPESGPLASSFLGVLFCALMKNDMVVSDLANMKFDEVPGFASRKFSPVEYCLAYTDGSLYDTSIKPKYRKTITDMYESEDVFRLLNDQTIFDHTNSKYAYTLKDTWGNVDMLANKLLIITK